MVGASITGTSPGSKSPGSGSTRRDQRQTVAAGAALPALLGEVLSGGVVVSPARSDCSDTIAPVNPSSPTARPVQRHGRVAGP